MILSKTDLFFETDDVSHLSLKMLWIVFLHPHVNNLWSSLLTIINISLCGFFIVFAIKGILLSDDIFFVAECMQTCMLMTHSIVKIVSIKLHKPTLKKLLNRKRNFWKFSQFDKEICEECRKYSNTTRKIIHLFYFVASLACLIFNLQPITTGLLPTVCYVPNGWFTYMMVILWYLSYVVVIGIPGIDGFFCSLTISVLIQYKLLSYEFRRMVIANKNSETKIWKVLNQLVNYHNFLTKYCEELNDIFKEIFLLQFFTAIVSASVSVFIFMQPGNWSNRIKFAVYFVSVITETTFYCVPSEILVNATTDVGHAIYESGWYKINNIKLKKAIVLVLVRAQKSLNFTGYGLVYMNLKAFVAVCKAVFSFYTYFNSIGQKK